MGSARMLCMCVCVGGGETYAKSGRCMPCCPRLACLLRLPPHPPRWHGCSPSKPAQTKSCAGATARAPQDLSSLLHKILEQPAAVLGGCGTDDRAALDEAMRQMQDDMALVGFDELQWWD